MQPFHTLWTRLLDYTLGPNLVVKEARRCSRQKQIFLAELFKPLHLSKSELLATFLIFEDIRSSVPYYAHVNWKLGNQVCCPWREMQLSSSIILLERTSTLPSGVCCVDLILGQNWEGSPLVSLLKQTLDLQMLFLWDQALPQTGLKHCHLLINNSEIVHMIFQVTIIPFKID